MSSEKWINDYFDAIYSYILLQVRNPHIAEDLTQDTFLKVIEKSYQFKGNSAVKTWIFKIAYTTTMSYFREKNPIYHLFNMNPDGITYNPSSEETVLLNSQHQYFYEALHRLKKNYQQVIVLRKIHDFSTEEVSSILYWSEGKVKMTLSRALVAFKKELEKEGITNETILRR